jgi:hypothetical protein
LSRELDSGRSYQNEYNTRVNAAEALSAALSPLCPTTIIKMMTNIEILLLELKD